MKAVFTHKPGSIYDDLPEERYHFPETYLRQAEATVGDFVIYYEPGRVGTDDRGRHGRRAYVAAAQVTGIRPDPASKGQFYADIAPETYVTFDRPVPFRVGEHYYERQLQRADGERAKVRSVGPCVRSAIRSSRRSSPQASRPSLRRPKRVRSFPGQACLTD